MGRLRSSRHSTAMLCACGMRTPVETIMAGCLWGSSRARSDLLKKRQWRIQIECGAFQMR